MCVNPERFNRPRTAFATSHTCGSELSVGRNTERDMPHVVIVQTESGHLIWAVVQIGLLFGPVLRHINRKPVLRLFNAAKGGDGHCQSSSFEEVTPSSGVGLTSSHRAGSDQPLEVLVGCQRRLQPYSKLPSNPSTVGNGPCSRICSPLPSPCGPAGVNRRRSCANSRRHNENVFGSRSQPWCVTTGPAFGSAWITAPWAHRRTPGAAPPLRAPTQSGFYKPYQRLRRVQHADF